MAWFCSLRFKGKIIYFYSIERISSGPSFKPEEKQRAKRCKSSCWKGGSVYFPITASVFLGTAGKLGLWVSKLYACYWYVGVCVSMFSFRVSWAGDNTLIAVAGFSFVVYEVMTGPWGKGKFKSKWFGVFCNLTLACIINFSPLSNWPIYSEITSAVQYFPVLWMGKHCILLKET